MPGPQTEALPSQRHRHLRWRQHPLPWGLEEHPTGGDGRAFGVSWRPRGTQGEDLLHYPHDQHDHGDDCDDFYQPRHHCVRFDLLHVHRLYRACVRLALDEASGFQLSVAGGSIFSSNMHARISSLSTGKASSKRRAIRQASKTPMTTCGTVTDIYLYDCWISIIYKCICVTPLKYIFENLCQAFQKFPWFQNYRSKTNTFDQPILSSVEKQFNYKSSTTGYKAKQTGNNDKEMNIVIAKSLICTSYFNFRRS